MSKRQWLMLLGALIIIIPYLGFPSAWSKIALVVLGLIIIAVSYRLAPGPAKNSAPSSRSLPYKEHQNHGGSSAPYPTSSKEEREITNASLPLKND